MDITEMRMQAKMHLRNHKLTMIYVCLIIGLINFIPNVLPNTTIGNSLSLILILLLVPMNHGYVTSSLKFVRGLGDQVDEKKDGFVGILRFKDLFTTYFLQEVLSALPLLIVGIAGLLLNAARLHDLPSLLANPSAYIASMNLEKIPSYYFVLVFASLCLTFWLTMRLAMTGYLLEAKGFKNFSACKQSFQMMKGYCWQYFKLLFSYILWIFLAMLLQNSIMSLLPGIIGACLAGVVSVMFQAYTYLPEQNVAVAVMFMRLLNIYNMNDDNL